MTWVRYDDGWGDRDDVLTLSLAARWHLGEMIRWVSRTKRYDGRMRAADARRCSDVEDPDGALVEIVEAGHAVVEDDGACYRLINVDDHVPPPHMREDRRKGGQRERQRRYRERLAGDDECAPSASPADDVTADVTVDVTRDMACDSGTGSTYVLPLEVGSRSVGGSGGKVTRDVTRDVGPSDDDLDRGFDEFWEVYPRKVSKSDARKKYRTARRNGATSEMILAAAKAQVTQWQREQKELRFIPHAATWLNQGRYNDQVEKPDLRLVSGGDSPWPSYQGTSDSPWVKGRDY